MSVDNFCHQSLREMTRDCNLLYFNVSSVEEADTLLYAEKHGDQDQISQKCRDIFSRVLAILSQYSKVRVYFEGETPDSTACLQGYFKEKILSSDSNTMAIKENLEISGWDYIARELRDVYERCIALEMQEPTLIKMHDAINQEILQLGNLIESKLGNDLQPSLSKFMELSDVDFQEIKDNSAKVLQLAQKKLEIQHFFDDIDLLRKELDHLNAREFPKRTASMVEALQQLRVARQTQEFTGKALFRSGKAHLQTLEKHQDKPEYDLTALYKELDNHRAVILIPKVIENTQGIQ